jgi:hypothetical protein
MFTRHQHASARGANRATRIVIDKSHPLLCKGVDARCKDFRLPIATQIAISKIICHDEYNVGLVRFDLRQGKKEI